MHITSLGFVWHSQIIHIFKHFALVFQCDVPEGGLVPKSLYFNREEEEDKDRSPDESPFSRDTLYHTAYVMKDWPHEVTISLDSVNLLGLVPTERR